MLPRKEPESKNCSFVFRKRATGCLDRVPVGPASAPALIRTQPGQTACFTAPSASGHAGSRTGLPHCTPQRHGGVDEARDPMINCRSANPRSARELFYQISRSFERGAVRFLFWWLFPPPVTTGNDSPTFVEPFAPFGGSVQRVLLVLIRVAKKTSQPPLAKPFGFDPRRQ
jgi:hypothetical protein